LGIEVKAIVMSCWLVFAQISDAAKRSNQESERDGKQLASLRRMRKSGGLPPAIPAASSFVVDFVSGASTDVAILHWSFRSTTNEPQSGTKQRRPV
jgi:hypothetical protein